jgi:hypothetical protein
MSNVPDSKPKAAPSIADLEHKYERLLDWANSHTELGLAWAAHQNTDESGLFRKNLVHSLEIGREIVISCQHAGTFSAVTSSQAFNNNVEDRGQTLLLSRVTSSNRDRALPLSGSLRFGGEPSTGTALRPLPLPEELSSRRMLAPSRSYSKKKAF